MIFMEPPIHCQISSKCVRLDLLGVGHGRHNHAQVPYDVCARSMLPAHPGVRDCLRLSFWGIIVEEI